MGIRFLLVFFAACSIAVLARSFSLVAYPDFTIYYTGAVLYMDGINPYVARNILPVPFLYPPHALFLLVPFTFLNLYNASILWTVLNFCLFFISLAILFRLHSIPALSNTGLILITLACSYFPVKFTLGMGQINIIVFFLLSLFLFYFHETKIIKASAALSAAILLKVVPIILVTYFIIKREYKALAVLLIFIFIIFMSTFIFFDLDTIRSYMFVVLPDLLQSPWKGDYYNQSLSGVLMRHVEDVGLRSIAKNVISASMMIITLFFIWRNRKKSNQLLSISTLLVVSLLISSVSWQHHFVWLLIPLITTFAIVSRKKLPREYYILLMLSYLLTAYNIKNISHVHVIFHSHVFYGALLLWILNLRLLNRSYD